jgi:hypothetical protein
MHSTYQGLSRQKTTIAGANRFGLTDPAVIEAYVNHRLNDPTLLSPQSGPSYADFFLAPTA